MIRERPSGATVLKLGIDTGGTFTDLIYLAGGSIRTMKVPSATATGHVVSKGVSALVTDPSSRSSIELVVHGATVATNAVLQHSGARTALVTTKGFRDVLELRRIRYPERYNPSWQKPAPLVERDLRFEIEERIAADGTVVKAIADEGISAIVDRLRAADVESVAICLLHSYANPTHEERLANAIAEALPGILLSVSSRLVPVVGEYERTSTVVCDAYVKPVVTKYQAALQQELVDVGVTAPTYIMQSNGGVLPLALASEAPVFALESGPAAGVQAAAALAQLVGDPFAVSFDMGGTTAKAALIQRGEPIRTTEYEVGAQASVGSRLLKGAGYMLKVRSLDVAEVGAGGGSIVEVDSAGGLHVGPRSSGAMPGPVCYARGGRQSTVTDANLLLGYLNPSGLLLGELPLDIKAAETAWSEQVARPMDSTIEASAWGAHAIANSNMERAIRLVSVERGLDARRATLIAFGGSGPVHAAHLAASIGIRRVIVPKLAGVFSALGLLTVPIKHEFVAAVGLPLSDDSLMAVSRGLSDLEARASSTLGTRRLKYHHLLDLRYERQHRELTIGVPRASLEDASRIIRRFEIEHRRAFGYVTDEPVLVENCRVLAVAAEGFIDMSAAMSALERNGIDSRPPGSRRAFFPMVGWVDTSVVGRGNLDESLAPGPMIVEEYDTSTVIPPGCGARLDAFGNLVLEVGRHAG